MIKYFYFKIVFLAVLAMFCSLAAKAQQKPALPKMPMSAPYENSLEYSWSQKTVLASKLLSDMESMGAWTHKGFGEITITGEKAFKGNSSLLITSPTKGPSTPGEGRPWGVASAIFNVNNEDWSDWNRISFRIYPDLPGFKVVSISLVFHNEGEDKTPDSYDRNGLNYQVLENGKWNTVYWEIAHLGRDKVSGAEIRYRLQGNEPGATETAKYYIDEMYLEKVNPDHFEGWNVSPDAIAYNHAGYAVGYPKMAISPDASAAGYTIKNATTGQIVKSGNIASKETLLGNFRLIDFSDLNTPGTYILEAGKQQSKPFTIGSFSDVYRSSIIKTVNHFYSQRCGYPVEGIHDACHRDWVCKHGDRMISIHGGWHDAGDLSQGLVNTAEAAYSMLMLAEELKTKNDAELADRLLEEARWGLDWMLKTRFGDGFRNVWATKDMWTDEIIGSPDDFSSNAQNDPHANLVSATTEATAAIAFREKDAFLAAYSLQCAKEDYEFGKNIEQRRMSVELAGAALNASLALYKATGDVKYKTEALGRATYIMQCQQITDLTADVPYKGFFYRTPEKKDILHYPHRGHEQDAVVGLTALCELFPTEAAEWKKCISLYADFYKKIISLNTPYCMIPAGIYDLNAARTDVEKTQIQGGIRLNDRYFLKRFPVWTSFRGNSGTTLSQAKGLSVVAKFLKDKELQDMIYHIFDWHLGMNPFTQSLMYGEGYRYAGQYSVTSGNIVGGMPVGVQTHFDRDVPYWPAENCYNWKEIWVHPSCRWLMLMHDFI